MKPLVSVIMPTYNTNKDYLKKSIDSIINQSYDFFELIIIDDSSFDDFDFISQNYNDKRIKLYRNKTNLGIASTLNKGLDLAIGDFIVRMDSDDIAQKNRLSEQVKFLQKNPSIDIMGSSIKFIGDKKGKRNFPKGSDEIKASFFFGSPLVHPSIIFKAEKIKKNNIRYNPEFRAEDYELWTRCAQISDLKFSNYPKVLLKYRIHKTQVTNKTKNSIKESSNLVRSKYIQNFGLQFNIEEIEKFNAFSQGAPNFNYNDFLIIDNLLLKIIEKNNEVIKIDKVALEKTLAKKMFKEYLRKLLGFKVSVKSFHESEVIKNNPKYFYFLKIGSTFCFR